MTAERDIMKRYEFGALANSLLKSGAEVDKPYAMIGALEKQLDQFGLNALDRDNLMNGLNSDESQQAKLGFLKSCANTYVENSGKMLMGEHFSEYDAVLQAYLVAGSPEYDAAKDAFDAVSGETLADIQGKLKTANTVVEDADALGIAETSAQYQSAKNDLESYGKVIALYSTLETDKMESIRNNAVKPTMKRMLKSIVGA